MIVNNIKELVKINKNANVSKIEAISLVIDNKQSTDFFFCGAVIDSRDHIIAIPNKYPHVLEIFPENNSLEQWGDIEISKEKGWTGGGLSSDGLVYGFPRGAGAFLILNTFDKQIEYKKLKHPYMLEHHYGGVINYEDVIYQPPKNLDTILSYDVKFDQEKEICINKRHKRRLFYGGMLDLEENAYFFPAGKFTRVCMVDNKGKAILIGKIFNKSFFNSGTLSVNGDIYSFSSYDKGILHIDTKNKSTEIIQKNIQGGFFGAKLGFNGKIYGIPGNSNFVLEYDPLEDKITDRIPLPDCEIGLKAKCAGGAIDSQGNIWCVPAMGHYIYKICFEGIGAVPSHQLYKTRYFNNFY